MVSSNMGLGSDNIIEEVEYIRDVNFRRIEKTVGVNGEWESRVFYEIKPVKYEYEEWLKKNYGQANYQTSWWITHTSIVMRDIIYTHWRLSF